MNKKLIGLDHLRALAIMLVFLFHYRIFAHPSWIDDLGSFGWVGVDLFFVLSGYLIYNQLFNQLKLENTIQLNNFYIKRFFRIIPPYLVMVFLYFSFPYLREKEALPPLWKFLTFTQNYGLDVFNKGTFSHAWSLCIEEQFYLTLPFFLLIFFKNNFTKYILYFLILLFLVTPLFRYFSWEFFVKKYIDTDNFWLEWYQHIYYTTHTRLDGLLVGVGLGFLMNFSEKIRITIHKKGNFLFLMGILVLMISYFICKEQSSFIASIFGFSIVAIGFGFLVASSVSESSFLYYKNSFVTKELATLSYAIYLSHKMVIHVVQSIIEKINISPESNFTLLLCIFACIFVAYLFRILIEKPALYFRNLILKK